jgi:hypothetical protein
LILNLEGAIARISPHTRLRLLVSKAFTPAAVEQLAPFIRRTVDETLDAAKGRGRMDVMCDLAQPLPVTVIAHLLGVPPEDHARFKKWSDDISVAAGNVQSNLLPEHLRQAVRSWQELLPYLRVVVAERRAQPRADLLSVLVKAEEAGDRLSEGELFANTILLLNAGHETTTNLIGNGTYAPKKRCTSTTMSADFSAWIVSGAWSLMRASSLTFSCSVMARLPKLITMTTDVVSRPDALRLLYQPQRKLAPGRARHDRDVKYRVRHEHQEPNAQRYRVNRRLGVAFGRAPDF